MGGPARSALGPIAAEPSPIKHEVEKATELDGTVGEALPRQACLRLPTHLTLAEFQAWLPLPGHNDNVGSVLSGSGDARMHSNLLWEVPLLTCGRFS